MATSEEEDSYYGFKVTGLRKALTGNRIDYFVLNPKTTKTQMISQ